MFGPKIPTFSLGRIVGGLSKTLGVVNQIIPLYKEAKPVIQNAKNAVGLIKEFTNTATNRVMSKKEEHLAPIKEKINAAKNTTQTQKGPTFFW